MSTPAVTIIVLAKAPVPGRVKTRLCPPCSYEDAAQLAAAALGDTLDAVAHAPAARRVLFLDGKRPPWVPTTFEVLAQRGGGLDERLAGAFADIDGPAILVGMDTPQLTPQLLSHAIDELLAPAVDSVIGHAQDGGWWTLGLRRSDPQAFLGVPMSLPTTGASQVERLDSLGLRVATLPSLIDVDDFPSAAAVAAGAPRTRFARAFDRLAISVTG
ncbi:MAG: DUF2064 domain-containing protein [Actinomycetota bacterium]|nr:DUF2064 domain-containing protein [Actinomycetota bacterium]